MRSEWLENYLRPQLDFLFVTLFPKFKIYPGNNFSSIKGRVSAHPKATIVSLLLNYGVGFQQRNTSSQLQR